MVVTQRSDHWKTGLQVPLLRWYPKSAPFKWLDNFGPFKYCGDKKTGQLMRKINARALWSVVVSHIWVLLWCYINNWGFAKSHPHLYTFLPAALYCHTPSPNASVLPHPSIPPFTPRDTPTPETKHAPWKVYFIKKISIHANPLIHQTQNQHKQDLLGLTPPWGT